MSEVKKNKRGRKAFKPWNKANLLWKTSTNREIAEVVGCSVVAVHLKRKAKIAAEIEAGRDGSKYECNRPRYSRAKFLQKKGEDAPKG